LSLPACILLAAEGSLFVQETAVRAGYSFAQGSEDQAESPIMDVSASPQFGHVFIVVEENHSFSSVIGNPDMPYLNSLVNQSGLAANYFADTHPSIGNYFMLTTGQIITNDDGFMGTVTADNIVRQLLAAGKTWKSYAESLPSVGYTSDGPYPYVRNHNPLSYLSDVVNNPTQLERLRAHYHRRMSNPSLSNLAETKVPGPGVTPGTRWQ